MKIDSITLKKITDQLAIDVDNYCDRKWQDEHRNHLGFSLIGDECQRKLWYGFRWALLKRPEPRLKRLFDRGHNEEDRFVDYLRGIGCTVFPFDHNYRLLIVPFKENQYEVLINVSDQYNERIRLGAVDVSDDMGHIKKANDQGITYPVQWKVSAVYGHSGGSLDGRGYLPKSYGIEQEILFEFKTHNGNSFSKLKKEGMKMSKPIHYAQMCGYGYLLGLQYGLYVAVNKNDDDLYFELVELNHTTGSAMVTKAERIIRSVEPPPKMNENPTFWVCKMCDYFSICQGKAEIERNCRSCKFAEPVQEGKWCCNKHNQLLTKDIIAKEWQCWESII